jgi:hypothetical protein
MKMKKMVMVIMVLCFAAQAMAENTSSNPQVQLTIGHGFWQKGNISGFAFGSFLYSINTSYPVALGYVGPSLKLGNFNLYTMCAVMGEPIGTSVGPSLWLEYAKGKESFFLEYDHFESWMSSEHGDNAIMPPASYYGALNYGHKFADNVTVGLAGEIIGYYDSQPFELAFGPYVQFNKFKVWLGYNETPSVDGQENLIIRLKFGF